MEQISRGLRTGGLGTLSGDGDALRSDELRLQARIAVLVKHLDDLAKVVLQLVEGLPLRVGTGKTGHVADVEPRIGATLNDCSESFHRS